MTAKDARSTCSSRRVRSAIISARELYSVACRKWNGSSGSCHWSAIGPSDNGDGYDADWFREALKQKGIRACIPGRKQRKTAVRYDKRRYKRRNRIEIMFGRLKDWRRVATRYDRCPEVFLSAIALAATVMFWL